MNNKNEKLSAFDYHLPEEKIAKYPTNCRDESKLLVLDKNEGTITDERFKNLVEYLQEGDLLIINNTKVIPARLHGKKKTGGAVEVLLLESLSDDYKVWKSLTGSSCKVRVGTKIFFDDYPMEAIIREKLDGYKKKIEFKGENLEQNIKERGEPPIPPYIDRDAEEIDQERYQTVFAEKEGAVAAPTAGLHFTEELLDRIKKKGIKTGYVTLHVGWGTFKKVQTADISEHEMHSEYAILPKETAEMINNAKERGNRVISVGTTCVRVLETAGQSGIPVKPFEDWTDLYIYPPYNFKVVDSLVTNFHLPKSSLIILVSAFGGRDNLLQAYEYAKENDYRFYSYGDAMFIK